MKDLLPFNNTITIKDHLYSKTLKLTKAFKKKPKVIKDHS